VIKDAEGLVDLMNELGGRLSEALGGIVPSEARQHLLNAQKELLTGLFLIYEHQVGARRADAPAGGGDEASPPRSRKIERIDVE
jgi:hypothetical protein